MQKMLSHFGFPTTKTAFQSAPKKQDWLVNGSIRRLSLGQYRFYARCGRSVSHQPDAERYTHSRCNWTPPVEKVSNFSRRRKWGCVCDDIQQINVVCILLQVVPRLFQTPHPKPIHWHRLRRRIALLFPGAP